MANKDNEKYPRLVLSDKRFPIHQMRDDRFHTYLGKITDIRQYLMSMNPDRLDDNELSKIGTSYILKKAIEFLHGEYFEDEQ